jgi:hypothetical protein
LEQIMKVKSSTKNMILRQVLAAALIGYFGIELFLAVFDGSLLDLVTACGGLIAGVLLSLVFYTDFRIRQSLEERLTLATSRATQAEARILDLAHNFNSLSVLRKPWPED